MIAGIQSVPSPGLIVFPDRVHANITRMIQMAGSPDRLRPHLKTAKMPEIVALYLDAGIYQFKCATLSEMRMALLAGAKDVLLAATYSQAFEAGQRLESRPEEAKLPDRGTKEAIRESRHQQGHR